MKQSIVNVSLVIKDYNEAIDFYTKKLHFTLVADEYQQEQNKRWVVIAPPGAIETRITLGRAKNKEEEKAISNQTGGRVFLSLSMDDFWRDYKEMVKGEITFARKPKEEKYGIVAVFEDLYGNLWDLIQYRK